MALALVTVLAAVSTYSFIRRLFWLEDETRTWVKLTARLRGHPVEDENVALSLDEMRVNRRKVGVMMIASWAVLIMLLANQH